MGKEAHMIIENKANELVIRLSKNLKVDDLQDIIDFLEYKELTKKNKTPQNEVDDLVKSIKKGRWGKTTKIG
nr:hypothetical protein [Cytophagales bacterium]